MTTHRSPAQRPTALLHGSSVATTDSAAQDRFVPDARSLACSAPWLSPVELDVYHLTHSEFWRRLADTTQVYSGPPGLHRNRLTHSGEVAQTAVSIGTALGCDTAVLRFAGMAHDMGHPPFGHNGEDVLAAYLTDHGGFEGNAQSFRILTRLAESAPSGGRSVGFNATRVCLDSTIKYPWSRGDAPTQKPHKFGHYDDDGEYFQWVRAGAPDGRLCLEAQVMDWADNVSYAVADVMDGARRGERYGYGVDGGQRCLIDLSALLQSSELQYGVAQAAAGRYCDADPDRIVTVVREYLTDNAGLVEPLHGVTDPQIADTPAARRSMALFAHHLRMTLQSGVISATREKFGVERLGRYDADLIVDEESAILCGFLQAGLSHFVLGHDAHLATQRQEREVLWALIDGYTSQPELLPTADRELWRGAPDESGRRRVIADRVAGMTNSGVYAEHRRLSERPTPHRPSFRDSPSRLHGPAAGTAATRGGRPAVER